MLVECKDPDAFAVLYDRLAGPINSLAQGIVGDRTLAEEVTQDAFLSVWRHGGFDAARGSVCAWVFSIARHRALDIVRRSSGAPHPLGLGNGDRVHAQSAPDALEADVIRQENARQVRGALKALPSEQKEVLSLTYFGGFSQSEISQMLGAPLGTVKGRIRLGLAKIRATLAEGVQTSNRTGDLP